MAGRQAQGGSCTAAVRLVAEAVVYTSSPLHHPPVKSDPALAARGYKTHNCRKAQVAQTKAVSPLKNKIAKRSFSVQCIVILILKKLDLCFLLHPTLFTGFKYIQFAADF